MGSRKACIIPHDRSWWSEYASNNPEWRSGGHIRVTSEPADKKPASLAFYVIGHVSPHRRLIRV